MSRTEGASYFPGVVRDVERLLVESLSLRPIALPSALARAEGKWKGSPVVIETSAYGGGVVAYARFAIVWQPGADPGVALEIGNVLALGTPGSGLPILGADLVGMGLRGRMIAADLSPTLPPGAARDAQLALLADGAAARARLTPGGELPDWCARFFSAHALFVRPTPEELPAALAELDRYPRLFSRLAREPRRVDEGTDATTAAVQRRYVAAHRTDDKGLGMLAKMFGEAWARRYVADVLFPSGPAVAGHPEVAVAPPG